jgi:peptide/nickel transport system permease protein
MAIFSPIYKLISPMFDPLTGVDPKISYSSPPSFPHLLGTDFLGRDIFSQLLQGAQIAFLVGITSAVLSVFFGIVIGLVSGFYGRWIDAILMRFTDIVLILPGLPFLILFGAVVGKQSVFNLIILIAIFGWPSVARVIRSQVLTLKNRPYVEAAKISGVPNNIIIIRYILPFVLPLGFLYITFGISSAILTEAALSFIGLGDASVVSWGMMLQWAFTTGHTFKAPYWILPPGLCISFISLAFYLIGKGLEQRVMPRLKIHA